MSDILAHRHRRSWYIVQQLLSDAAPDALRWGHGFLLTMTKNHLKSKADKKLSPLIRKLLQTPNLAELEGKGSLITIIYIYTIIQCQSVSWGLWENGWQLLSRDSDSDCTSRELPASDVNAALLVCHMAPFWQVNTLHGFCFACLAVASVGFYHHILCLTRAALLLPFLLAALQLLWPETWRGKIRVKSCNHLETVFEPK